MLRASICAFAVGKLKVGRWCGTVDCNRRMKKNIKREREICELTKRSFN